MARTKIFGSITEMLPTAAGGTLGVFTGMMVDDAMNTMLQGKSANVVVWANFGTKAALSLMLITMSRNESALLREGGAAAGSALLGTALFQLLVHLNLIK